MAPTMAEISPRRLSQDKSGQGSLSNLKLVEGSKAGGKEGEKTTREIKASLKLQGGETDFFVWKYQDS